MNILKISIDLTTLVVSILWVVKSNLNLESIISFFQSLRNLATESIQKKEELITRNEVPVTVAETVSLAHDIKEAKETEVEKIVKKFNQVIEIVNYNRIYNKYTITKLDQILRFNKVSELENVFLGKEEPTFEFINYFCETFGINKEWLIEGQRGPFYNLWQNKLFPSRHLEDIKRIEPQGIYFIRCNSDIGETFILLKLSDHKYKILSRTWYINSHVGGTGQEQIFEFYKLIKDLCQQGCYEKCDGRILNKKIFDGIYNGKRFPVV